MAIRAVVEREEAVERIIRRTGCPLALDGALEDERRLEVSVGRRRLEGVGCVFGEESGGHRKGMSERVM